MLIGGAGSDILRGGPGADHISAGYGHDRVHGGTGDDGLAIVSGVVVAWLGDGDDSVTIFPDDDRDVVDCGPGDDTVQFFGERDPHDVLRGCETTGPF